MGSSVFFGCDEDDLLTNGEPLIVVAACAHRSGTAFCAYSMLLCNGFGDVDSGCRYAELALEISRRYGAQEWAIRTLCGAYGFCLVWKRPLQDLLIPLLEGHESGLATGDIEVGTRQGYEVQIE
jgi:predicted ATPase